MELELEAILSSQKVEKDELWYSAQFLTSIQSRILASDGSATYIQSESFLQYPRFVSGSVCGCTTSWLPVVLCPNFSRSSFGDTRKIVTSASFMEHTDLGL